MLNDLYQLSRDLIENNYQEYRRYFMQDTTLTERMAIILGQRGIGKTTVLTQKLFEYADNKITNSKILYLPVDHFLLANKSLYQIAENFYLHGGEFIAFDEIHKYPNWAQELKSIYDTFKQLKILASGSSAMEIQKGSHDLSRRAVQYHMVGMSFREYLGLKFNSNFKSYNLTDILANHEELVRPILKRLISHQTKILKEFKSYCLHGYYPYYQDLQNEIKFQITLEQNIHATLENDLVAIHTQLNANSLMKLKRLLAFIAHNVPMSINWRNIKQALDIGDERTLKNYFKFLQDAELITVLYKSSKRLGRYLNAEKVYLQNPNLMQAIARSKSNIGSIREVFFYNMLSKNHQVTVPLKGDFMVDEKFLFEVGGTRKNKKQIAECADAYLIKDDIEKGINNQIPLWLFGFLY